jgi:cell pole-organizing protein PopZ
MSGDKEVDTKLEDILKSIRGIIDNHNQAVNTESNGSDFIEEEAILELTSVISSDKNHFIKDENKSFISAETRRKTESELNKFANHMEESEYSLKDKSLDSMVNVLMRPLVKEWLDSNLPRIVEKVVSEEIRKMVPKR